VTEALLAQAFAIDQVVVSKAVYNSAAENLAASMSFVAPKSALMVYRPPAPGLMVPSAGYTFGWQGFTGLNNLGVRVAQIPMNWLGLGTIRNEAEMAFDMQIVGKDLGFYFSGISLAILDATARARLFQLLHAQKAAGKHVVFDNNYRPKLWPDRITTQQVFNQAFEVATIALITADDHQAVYNLPDLDAAITHAKQRPVKEIVIKRGAAPSLVNDSETGDWLEIATQKVEKVVDTTAAGDSFAAGYLSRRLLGQSPAESAAFGNKVASRVVQHRGAIIPAEAMNDLM
jgi:hypothetical protein